MLPYLFCLFHITFVKEKCQFFLIKQATLDWPTLSSDAKAYLCLCLLKIDASFLHVFSCFTRKDLKFASFITNNNAILICFFPFHVMYVMFFLFQNLFQVRQTTTSFVPRYRKQWWINFVTFLCFSTFRFFLFFNCYLIFFQPENYIL